MQEILSLVYASFIYIAFAYMYAAVDCSSRRGATGQKTAAQIIIQTGWLQYHLPETCLL